nr:hypothetical protein [Tanacetum cinerariifolium]
MQTNQFAGAVSSIPGIVDRYIDHRMNEAVKVAVQIQSDRLRDEAQAENEDFLNKLDENIQKIIKEQVKVQVSKILPKIEKTVNEQLEAEVLTRLSNSSKTSYAVVADLSKMELKKILIEKMESNNAPKEKASKTIGKSTEESKSHQKTASEFAPAEEPMQTTQDLEEPSHQEFETGAADDQPIAEASQHPEWFQKKNETSNSWLCLEQDSASYSRKHSTLPLPLITNSRGRRVIPFDHFINNDLEYLRGGASSQKYTTSVTKTKAADYGHIKWIEDLVPRTMWSLAPVRYDKYALWGISHWGRKRQQFYEFAVNRESARDVYSKRRIIAVTELQIVEWHDYKNMDWITVRRDDDKLYKFKEGDFKRLHIQDIEDMLLLLVQGKLTLICTKPKNEVHAIVNTKNNPSLF